MQQSCREPSVSFEVKCLKLKALVCSTHLQYRKSETPLGVSRNIFFVKSDDEHQATDEITRGQACDAW